MASEFTFTDPEASRQNVARIGLQAALAETAARENIERERTAAQRYATQSQIQEREKDRAVSREGIASEERWRTAYGANASANPRNNQQYQTILSEINDYDPLTKRELEARIAASTSLTPDLANDLRSRRETAYKTAKSAYAVGEQLASNYRARFAELDKTPNASNLKELLKDLNADRNVIYDAASRNVRSAYHAPREDLTSPTVSGISPAQDYGGASAKSATTPTIGDMYRRATGSLPAISPSQDYGGAAPIAGATPVSPPDFMDNYESYGMPRGAATNAAPYSSIAARNAFGLGTAAPAPVAPPTAPYIPPFADMSDPMRIAPPVAPLYGPPDRSGAGFRMPIPFQEAPPFIDMSDPYRRYPTMSELYGPPDNMPYMGNDYPPRVGLPYMGTDYPPRVRRSTDFAVPPHMQTLPRMWDLRTLRPEFRPPMEDYIPLR